MSAQIIMALRARAEDLEAEARAIAGDTGGAEERPRQPGEPVRNVNVLRAIAAEFEALADTAEGLD